jgi:uncharacterized coiled-coil DUF342 family protein
MHIVMDAIYRSKSTEAMERKVKFLIATGLLAATMSTALAQSANDLGNQLDRADRANDTKKTEEVSQKLDELERKLPEYTALVDGLKDVGPNSQDAQKIGSIILKLDELCD